MSKSSSSSSGGGCGCFGCLTFILFAIVIWALIFGVTVSGRHYLISCTTDRGVVIE